MVFLPDAENRMIVSSFLWTKHRNVTDGQTDRQTESPWLLQRSALRESENEIKAQRYLQAYTHRALLNLLSVNTANSGL